MAAITGKTVPVLPAQDIAASIDWYTALGFVCTFRQEGAEPYAILARAAMELHLFGCPDRHVAENTSCYIRLDALDALHAEFTARGIQPLSPMEVQPWGMREFYAWDPSGNLLRFGEPR